MWKALCSHRALPLLSGVPRLFLSVPVIVVRWPPRAVFAPTVSGSGTTSASIAGGPKSKSIVALGYINKAVAASAIQRTKTLATVTKVVGPTTVNGVTSYHLAKPDLFDITSIKDTNSSGVDVSSKFIIDKKINGNNFFILNLHSPLNQKLCSYFAQLVLLLL